MDDVLGYAGKRVVVGGAFSGMGNATATALIDLGASVVALDIRKPELPVAEYVEVDLRDKAAIDGAVAAIRAGGPVDALFTCAGLPGAPFSGADVMAVNYYGTRHLIESLAPGLSKGAGIAWVSSNAGLGWQMNLEMLTPGLDAEGFDGAKAWHESVSEVVIDAMCYPISKQLVNAYVAKNAKRYYETWGVRFNTTNPGPTATPMMPQFEENNGKGIIEATLGPIHRYSTAEEQAWPLLYLNSPRSSFITGETLMVDGGFLGAMTFGQIDMSAIMANYS
jgi:NAD(P)-dependent dehydrogenase (short-subunit alcohol dehydrogenase family)